MAIGSGISNHIWKAIKQLNPGKAVHEAQKLFTFALIADNEDDLQSMREFLLGRIPSAQEAENADRVIKSFALPLDEAQSAAIGKAEFVLAAGNVISDSQVAKFHTFTFDADDPESCIKAIAGSRVGAELRVPLAARLPALRKEIARRVIRDVAGENAIFVVATGLGDYIPSWLLPIIGVAEAASDTVFLTANQVRMLFILGAIYGVGVGYTAQWKEISSIVGAAFGWRALARELVSKIPFGGGLIPKGAIAYSGTAVAGEGLIFFYTTGRHMTRSEVSEAFKSTYDQALDHVRSLVEEFRHK